MSKKWKCLQLCDNCKKSADEDTMYSCWNDEGAAKDVAMEANYITEGIIIAQNVTSMMMKIIWL
jgi:hypothetical protein